MSDRKTVSIVATMIVSFALALVFMLWQQGALTETRTTLQAATGTGAPRATSPLTATAPAASPPPRVAEPVSVDVAGPPASPPNPPAPPPNPVSEAATAAPWPQRGSEIEQFARASPLRDPMGNMTGMRVFPGQDPEQFYRSGLKGGDVIVAINGTPVDGSANSAAMWEQLSTGSTVTVERRGKQQDITLNTAP